jgi:hypothetical protein
MLHNPLLMLRCQQGQYPSTKATTQSIDQKRCSKIDTFATADLFVQGSKRLKYSQRNGLVDEDVGLSEDDRIPSPPVCVVIVSCDNHLPDIFYR